MIKNSNVCVVGVGNILFLDEGVGIYASAFLENNYQFEPGIDIIDGGTLGFKLMDYFQSYDRVIILDTISIEDAPGSIYNIPSEELMGLGTYRKTAHEVEVVEMLEICTLLENVAEVSIVGIIPEDIETVKIDLSEALKKHFESFIATVLKDLDKAGIKYTKKEQQLTLDQIINDYNNPTSTKLAS